MTTTDTDGRRPEGLHSLDSGTLYAGRAALATLTDERNRT